MQTRREVLKLMGLTTAAVVMGGCVPQSMLGVKATDTLVPESPKASRTLSPSETATTQPTATEKPTATETPTMTVTPETLSDQESLFYKPEVNVPVSFTVDGVTLNWGLGLTESLVERTTEPVKNVVVHQDLIDQMQLLGRLYIEMCRENYNASSGKAPVNYNQAAQLMKDGKMFIKMGATNESTATKPSDRSDVTITDLTNTEWLFSGNYGTWPVVMGNVSVYMAKNLKGDAIIGDGFDIKEFSWTNGQKWANETDRRNVLGAELMVNLANQIMLIGFSAQPNVREAFKGGDLYGTYPGFAPVGYSAWADFSKNQFHTDFGNAIIAVINKGTPIKYVFEVVQ